MSELPEQYLLGARLFNEGKFFECHEAWEHVWLKSDGTKREFLHAIIQAAAALHHFQRGNLKGATSVGRRAIGKLATMPGVVMQFDTGSFRLSLENWLLETDAPIPCFKIEGEDQ